MIDLDDLEIYRHYDSDGMREHIRKLPWQLREAWQKSSEFTLPANFANIDKIIICGMGGSAIGGELIKSFASNLTKPIIFIHRDYDLPAFVDSRTLVIASSYSGNTEETLSNFTQAMDIDCPKIAITTGGKLKDLAKAKQIPVFTIDYACQPRAALGYSFIPLISLLAGLVFIEGKSARLDEAVQTLEALLDKLAEDIPTVHNPAKQLAHKLFGKLIIIYGAGILSPVAQRWKGQFNENSKTWAFYETFSELNHNAVVGYEFPKEMADKIYVILLRSPSLLHPRILARYRITSEILQKAKVKHEIIDSQSKGKLAQMMSLIFLGDWTSYYLAMLNQIDPTPVKMIDYLKERLDSMK
jgi:glucose/mannose-6-phosphate isomerase